MSMMLEFKGYNGQDKDLIIEVKRHGDSPKLMSFSDEEDLFHDGNIPDLDYYKGYPFSRVSSNVMKYDEFNSKIPLPDLFSLEIFDYILQDFFFLLEILEAYQEFLKNEKDQLCEDKLAVKGDYSTSYEEIRIVRFKRCTAVYFPFEERKFPDVEIARMRSREMDMGVYR